MVTTPYSNGYLYYPEGTDKLILADGTMYIIHEPNEKSFIKASCHCDNDTHASLRAWYNMFTQVAHDYVYYIHPLWCFCKNHGSIGVLLLETTLMTISLYK